MAVLGVGLPSFVRSATPTSPGPPAATEQTPESEPAQDATPAASTAMSPSFFHPLQATLACRADPPPLDRPGADFGAWAEHCELGRIAQRREAIIAVVPDPHDSLYENVFDRILEAIDRAAAKAGYVRDRYYLPWQSERAARRRDNRTAPAPGSREHETTPGLLLFRRTCGAQPPAAGEADDASCKPGVLAVLLVGETSAWGVHHRVLERALMVADSFETDFAARRLRILGPTFSGSVSSLHDALEHHLCTHPMMRHTGFDVVTGEATGANNAGVMQSDRRDSACRAAGRGDGPPIVYHATVTNDGETMQRFYRWLAGTMGLDLKNGSARPCTLAGVGILTEDDTEYARGFAPSDFPVPTTDWPVSVDGCKGPDPAFALKPELVVRYPSRLAHLRSVYERTRRHDAAPAQLAVDDRQRMLDLSLADSDEAVEAVPAFSDKTQYADELVLAESLKAMCRSDLRFLGIIGVDITNRLFLAREVQRYCPDVRLFSLESDVLYAHPDVADDMNGSLIVSPYPLFPQNGAWTPPTARGVIAPFGDSAAQGSYNAVLHLLAQQDGKLRDKQQFETMPPHPRVPPIDDDLPVWVSAAGNGTLWPVTVVPRDHPREAPATDDRVFVTTGQWKWAFGAIWLTCSFLALGYWVGRYPPRRHIVALGLLRLFRGFGVFRPVKGAAIEHALFSLLALAPVTCAYVAAAGFVLFEHILRQPQPWEVFDQRLLYGIWAGCADVIPGVPAVATGLALIAACVDAVVALVASVTAKLRGRAPETRWFQRAGLIAAGIALGTFLVLKHGLVFPPDVWIMLRERAIRASSGLSPLLPAGVFAAAIFFAARMQLVRMHHRASPRIADPMAECDHPAVAGMHWLRDHILDIILRFGGGAWPGALLAVLITLVWWFGGMPRAMTTLEGPVWNWPLALQFLAGLVLVAASYAPFVVGCYRLRDYLRRHANLPCVEAFSRLPGRAAQKMSVILVQPPPPVEMARALQQLRLLSSQVHTAKLKIDDELRIALYGALSAASTIEEALVRELDPHVDPPRGDEPARTARQLLHDVAATLAQVVASQWERPASRGALAATRPRLRKLAADHGRDQPTAELYRRAADNETQIWLRLAEEFVATQSTTFFHDVLHTLRQLLTTATVTALLLLAGASSYPFERRPMLLFMMQGLVVGMVVITVA
ncbi:MAG TPA: hypothetical protein VFK02_02590, partial [Kofleriaceae bacterium]|nr:hypothetical protein [Kofleriaceae bacterium]